MADRNASGRRQPWRWESAEPARPARARVLLLSWHFPPGAAAGALRWEKLAALAAERGWQLDVVALHPAALERSDEARLARLPAGTRIVGVRPPALRLEALENTLWRQWRRLRPRPAHGASPPAPAASLAAPALRFRPAEARSWIRAWTAWLDVARGRSWAREAARAGQELAVHHAARAVVSCGPPHGAHLAGLAVATRLGLPWVMDLRDPWSLVERLPESLASPVWTGLARRDEARALRRADLVVMNTEAARDAMRRRHPARAERIVAVPNGWDEEPLPPVEERRAFRIRYAGTVYLDRTPRALLRAAARLVRERDLEPDAFGIDFMGAVDRGSASLEALAAAEGLAQHVTSRPPGTRSEAARFLRGGAMLVSLPQDSHLAIPSKVFEYMRYDAWLLAMAAPHSATAELLRDSGADVVAPEDVDGLADVLRRRVDEHRAGATPAPLARECFSRRFHAARLFEAMERRCGLPGAGSP